MKKGNYHFASWPFNIDFFLSTFINIQYFIYFIQRFIRSSVPIGLWRRSTDLNSNLRFYVNNNRAFTETKWMKINNFETENKQFLFRKCYVRINLVHLIPFKHGRWIQWKRFSLRSAQNENQFEFVHHYMSFAKLSSMLLMRTQASSPSSSSYLNET